MKDSDAEDKLLSLLNRAETAGQIIADLEKKTDAEISDLLVETVWSEMVIFSPKAVLLEDAIRRLRKEPPLTTRLTVVGDLDVDGTDDPEDKD